MYQTVGDLLTENAAVFADHKAFNRATSDLDATVQTILGAVQQKQSRSGAVAAKKDLVRTLGDQAVTVAGAVVACATATHDPELASRFDYSRSRIVGGAEVSVVARCREIYAAGQEHLDGLGEYGVTAPTLSAFKRTIDTFEGLIPKPRNHRGKKAAATKALPKLLRQADTILKKRLDKMVVQFAESNADFVDKYDTARSIVDPASGSGNVSGTGAATPATVLPKAA